MILFPNSKINIGLRVVERRPDGYHNLASIFLPIGWSDVLEIVPGEGDGIRLDAGPDFAGEDMTRNLVYKAAVAVEKYLGSSLPPVDIYLRKVVPMGAGLGGGSADAAYTIRGLNSVFNLGLDDAAMARIAVTVGADCPFFIYNRPALVTGIGDVLREIDVSFLKGYGILVAKPASEAVSTAQAYGGIYPRPLHAEPVALVDAIALPPEQWRGSDLLVNDFEKSIFVLRPEIAAVKERMYAAGALYASMSGSGAAVFGIFPTAKMAEDVAAQFGDCNYYAGSLAE